MVIENERNRTMFELFDVEENSHRLTQTIIKERVNGTLQSIHCSSGITVLTMNSSLSWGSKISGLSN